MQRPLDRGARFVALLGTTERFLRVLAALLGLAALVALLPRGLGPVLTWVLVAAGLALGWSSRAIVADLVAGFALQLGHELRPRDWLEGPDFAGTVVRIGPRALILADPEGSQRVVPHRVLARSHFSTRRRCGPPVSATVDLDPELTPAIVRAGLHAVLQSSPWVDEAGTIEVTQSPDRPGHWTLRASLLDAAFTAEHLGTLSERIAEELAQRTLSTG